MHARILSVSVFLTELSTVARVLYCSLGYILVQYKTLQLRATARDRVAGHSCKVL